MATQRKCLTITHQVGIGALVVHPTSGKMLAVQERTGPAAKRKLWKMPTGLTDPGELFFTLIDLYVHTRCPLDVHMWPGTRYIYIYEVTLNV